MTILTQAEELEEVNEEVGEEVHSEEFEEQTALDQVISGVVVLLIVIALVVAWRLNKQFGGRLKAALALFTAGILVNLLAAFWGSFVSHRVAIGDSSFDTHNLFMALATLLFLASIHKFTRLIPRAA